MQLSIYIYKDPEFPIDSEISRTTWGMGQHYRCRKPLCFATFKHYFWIFLGYSLSAFWNPSPNDSGQELKQRLVAEIEWLEPLLALIYGGWWVSTVAVNLEGAPWIWKRKRRMVPLKKTTLNQSIERFAGYWK